MCRGPESKLSGTGALRSPGDDSWFWVMYPAFLRSSWKGGRPGTGWGNWPRLSYRAPGATLIRHTPRSLRDSSQMQEDAKSVTAVGRPPRARYRPGLRTAWSPSRTYRFLTLQPGPGQHCSRSVLRAAAGPRGASATQQDNCECVLASRGGPGPALSIADRGTRNNASALYPARPPPRPPRLRRFRRCGLGLA